MKIYTKTGDKGQCSLASGDRISKSSHRIECYGTVDELNSVLGQCRALAPLALPADCALFDRWAAAIQNDLFVVGGDLATPIDKRWEGMPLVGEAQIKALEQLIDLCQKEVPPLAAFILPAGNALCSSLHVARTVCRRAERQLVRLLEQEEPLNPFLLPLLNRLSDALFVLARWTQHRSGRLDVPWDKAGGLATLFSSASK